MLGKNRLEDLFNVVSSNASQEVSLLNVQMPFKNKFLQQASSLVHIVSQSNI